MHFEPLFKIKPLVYKTQQVFSILAFLKCQNGENLKLTKLTYYFLKMTDLFFTFYGVFKRLIKR